MTLPQANLDLSEEELEKMIQNPNNPLEGDDGDNEVPDPIDEEEAPADEDDGSDDGQSPDDDGEKKEPPKSIQKLLKQRNDAREKSNSYEAKLAEQDKVIAELQAKTDDTLTNDERQDKLLDAKMDKKLLEQDGRFEQKRQSDIRDSSVKTFVDNNADIGKYKNDFIEACQNYPDLSPRQVYAILADEMGIGSGGKGPGYGIAGGSKTKNGTPVDVNNMSESQLESEISNLHSNGGLL